MAIGVSGYLTPPLDVPCSQGSTIYVLTSDRDELAMATREDRVLKVMNVAMAAGATFAALTGALGFAEMIQIVSSLGAALLGAAFESSRVFSAK